MQTSFTQSLNIQLRVIYALVIRELVTRYGRNNIGFLWLLVEPIIFVTIIAAIFYFVRQAGFTTQINAIAFAITGYTLMQLWRGSINRSMGAVSANAALLYHRNVTVVDVFIARILLELIGVTLATLLLYAIAIVVLRVPLPDNILLMLSAWLLMFWFSIGIGLLFGAVSEKSEAFKRVWRSVGIITIPLSGAPFLVSWLPSNVQEFVLYFPMVQLCEMIRDGYFGFLIDAQYDVLYIIKCNIALMFLGLLLVRQQAKNGVV